MVLAVSPLPFLGGVTAKYVFSAWFGVASRDGRVGFFVASWANCADLPRAHLLYGHPATNIYSPIRLPPISQPPPPLIPVAPGFRSFNFYLRKLILLHASKSSEPLLQIRIRIFLGLPDPDLLVRGT